MANLIWEKYEEIFPLVADLPEAEREARLRELCAGDDELRREILALLKADEKAAGFIESPAALPDSLSQVFRSVKTENLKTAALESRQFGAYRVIRKIGAGGMGAVYLAERSDGEFRKKVAIKIVRNDADTDFNLRRFRHERQILAQLEHPNIARLLDGGTTEDGLPYLVMEYVEGKTLFDFCDARNLDLRERLRLFRQVCAAVEYAHERQIVHRDIKPANILVNENGEIKLLDFGIAKILDANFIGEAVGQTTTMMRQMTPEYAAPEQIKGEEITPATDVYSLGMVLYELLTGERPYKFTSRAPHEIARVICEEKVQSPKSKVQEALSDDLKFIVLKSLQKKPSERYASARDFDRDIAGFLEGEPILTAETRRKFFQQITDDSGGETVLLTTASPRILSTGNLYAGVAKTSGKTIALRRLKNPSAIAAVAAVVICTVLVVAANFKILVLKKPEPASESPAVIAPPSKRGESERSRSNDAAANELYQAGKQQLTTRTPEAINRAIGFFNEAVKRDPNFALAFSGLADAHIVLARQPKESAPTAYRKAEEYAMKALALDPDLAEARVSLAMATFRNTENFAAAEKQFLRAIEINPNLSRAHHWYSVILSETDQTEAALREIKIAAELEPRSAVIHHNVATLNFQLKRYADAIAYFDKTIELDNGFANVYLSKSIAQQMLGDYNGALETYRIGRIYSGKDENEPLWILMQAQTQAANGRTNESLTLLNSFLQNPVYRKEAPTLLFDIALAYTLLGDADKAFAWLEKIKVKKSKELRSISEDSRFARLHSDARFARLTEKWARDVNAKSKKS